MESGGVSAGNLIGTLALGSVAGSTHREYWARFRAFASFRQAKRKSPWLEMKDGEQAAVDALLEFMAFRCFVHKNQSGTIRGYLAAIKFFHRMYAGWDLPTAHCMVVAVCKGIDRAHGWSDVKPRTRRPLTWNVLLSGKASVWGMRVEGPVIWMGLAVSFLLLCRASELFAYNNGRVHSQFCLTRGNLKFSKGGIGLPWLDRRQADRVEVHFAASKSDRKREGATVTRTRVRREVGDSREVHGALEVLLDLLDIHPNLGAESPLMQTVGAEGWKVVNRTEATQALRLMVALCGKDPAEFALHSGRIGGATNSPQTGQPLYRSNGPADGNRRLSWLMLERVVRGRILCHRP